MILITRFQNTSFLIRSKIFIEEKGGQSPCARGVYKSDTKNLSSKITKIKELFQNSSILCPQK